MSGNSLSPNNKIAIYTCTSFNKGENIPPTHSTWAESLTLPLQLSPEPSIIRMKYSVKGIDIHLLAHARFFVDNLSEAAKRFSSSLTV